MNSSESVPAATGEGGRDKPAGPWLRWLTRSLLAGFLILIAAILAAAFATRVPADRMFRGKLESEWIAEVKHFDEEQAKEWREFGDEGIAVLTRGLRRAERPMERLHRRWYRATSRFLNVKLRVPIGWTGVLPEPKMDQTLGHRLAILSLLTLMRETAYPAAPAVLVSLADESFQVQQIAIGFFGGNERDSTPLMTLTPRQREGAFVQLKEFVAQTKDSGLRNNAAIALRFFPERKDELIPLLLAAMKDKENLARCAAAETLFLVAPKEANTKEVAVVLLELLNDPDDQIAYRAPKLLGQLTVDSGEIVADLIKHVKNKSSLVATEAARALGNFPEFSEQIVPVLWEAHKDPTNHVRTWGTYPSLEKLDPKGASEAGIR